MSNLVINICSRTIITTYPIYFFGFRTSNIQILSLHLALSVASSLKLAVSQFFIFPNEIDKIIGESSRNRSQLHL